MDRGILNRSEMKVIKLIVGIFLLFSATASALAQRDYCFKNDGLKVTQTISFTVTGHKVEGTMESGGYQDSTSAETFEFTGRRAGNMITVKFAGKPPYQLPSRTRTITWTLGSRSLRVPMFGKNYVSNKWSAYTAKFDRCKEL
jgi:hypothetical protein